MQNKWGILLFSCFIQLIGIIIACYYVDNLLLRALFVFILGLTGVSVSSLLKTLSLHNPGVPIH